MDVKARAGKDRCDPDQGRIIQVILNMSVAKSAISMTIVMNILTSERYI
jgi:hypothetical protein